MPVEPQSGVRRALRAATHPAVAVLAVAGVVAMLTDTRRLDGLVAVVAALVLVRDGARHGEDGDRPGRRPRAPVTGPVAAVRRRVAGTPRWPAVAGCVLLALVLASFERYSVPVSVAVWLLAAVVVALTWADPRTAPDAVPARGLSFWAGWALAACLWELGALLGQPSPTEGAYDSPTLSVLLDPVLATAPGRAVALAGWLLAGWWLCRQVTRAGAPTSAGRAPDERPDEHPMSTR